MSGGVQTLMRTRCPACATIFRVTSEQLRLKAGKVRCGHCQSVFNAFDEFVPDTAAVAPVNKLPDETPASENTPETVPEALEMPEAAAPTPEMPESHEPPDVAMAVLLCDPQPDPIAKSDEEPSSEAPEVVGPPAPEAIAEQVALPESNLETPEESTLAAREAGLVAPRELSEAPTYNRWAEGALAGDRLGGFGGEPARRAVWPFVLVAAILFLVLIGQLLYHFRGEIVQRWPDAAALYQLAAVDIPLAQNVDLVSIESSDLQSDNARGLFILQATLRNRANYPQVWPALELTLTDTNDAVVSRRVIKAEEYLPPGISPERFPANGEVAIRLWIEARDIGAAGYRLYIFYP